MLWGSDEYGESETFWRAMDKATTSALPVSYDALHDQACSLSAISATRVNTAAAAICPALRPGRELNSAGINNEATELNTGNVQGRTSGQHPKASYSHCKPSRLLQPPPLNNQASVLTRSQSKNTTTGVQTQGPAATATSNSMSDVHNNGTGAGWEPAATRLLSNANAKLQGTGTMPLLPDDQASATLAKNNQMVTDATHQDQPPMQTRSSMPSGRGACLDVGCIHVPEGHRLALVSEGDELCLAAIARTRSKGTTAFNGCRTACFTAH